MIIDDVELNIQEGQAPKETPREAPKETPREAPKEVAIITIYSPRIDEEVLMVKNQRIDY
jgi:hypothetical protein